MLLTNNFGWVRDDDSVAQFRESLPIQSFAATPAFLQPYKGPEEVFLWDAARTALGHDIPGKNQLSVGSCVGHGFTEGGEYCIAVEQAQGAEMAWAECAPEVTYGLSRVEIGGGRIGGDGSVGAWAAKAVRDYGLVKRGVYGNLNLTRYEENQCRYLGRYGVPDEVEKEAKLHPVKDVTQVASFDEAFKAIANGSPVAVCSDQGFTMTRDREGYCRPQGSWAHCMVFIGATKKSRPGLACLQSWGPGTPSGPIGYGSHPDQVFWVDADVADKMLSPRYGGDSWALSGAVGFPSRRLLWLV